MKGTRQAEILKIIDSMNVETQEQLLEELSRRGYPSTQATISRDMKQLHLMKELTESGHYRYVLPERKHAMNFASRLRTIFKESVTSFDVAQNIVVINTMPGLASAACFALDSMKLDQIVGTLAGDDTAILIMRTSEAAEEFCSEVRSMLN